MKKAATTAALAAVLAATAVAAQDKDTLVIRLNSDVLSLEPGGSRDANTDTVVHTMFEGLVGYRTDLSVGPALARSWTVSDDGKTYTFTLRDGVTFHNGATLTAGQVKWSWDRLAGGETWKCRRQFSGRYGLEVTAVEAPDAATVVYHLAQPSSLFLKQLANVQCQVLVMHPDSLGADGTFQTPIGTGPYKLADWKRDDRIALSRHDAYTKSDKPGSAYAGAREAVAGKLTYLIIPDANSAEAALKTGAIDVLPGVAPDRIEGLKAAGIRIQTAPGLGWSPVLIQTQDPVLSDAKLRRALAHAIDSGQIAEARTGGLADGNPSAVSRSSAYFDDAFLRWPAYDPAKAAAMAKEAGYKGEEIVLQANKKYTGMYDRAVIVHAMLQAAGFNVKLEVMDWATQLDHYLKGTFQMQSFGYSARLDPGMLYGVFVGDKQKQKWAQWDNAEARDLVARSALTNIDAERQAIFKKLHALMAEDVPIIPLYFTPTIDGVRPGVDGFTTWAAARPLPWGVSKN